MEVEEGVCQWRLPGVIMLLVTLIVTRQIRGVHAGKVLELAESIQSAGWLANSFITVQLDGSGGYRLVDGMHRISAIMYLISTGKWSPTRKLECVVFKYETPYAFILRYAALANGANSTFSHMTYIDKMRWVCIYMCSLLPLWMPTKGNKNRPLHWHDLSCKYVADAIQGEQKVAPKAYSLATLTKLMGVLRAIRVDADGEQEEIPLTDQASTAYTDMLLFDQLGRTGVAVWHATYQFSYPPGEKINRTLPGTAQSSTSKHEWRQPVLIFEANSYPGVWTRDISGKLSADERELPFKNPRMHFLMRLFMGTVARTGLAPSLAQANSFVTMMEAFPRLVVLWGRLKAIAEKGGLMVWTGHALGYFAEGHGKGIADAYTNTCRCNCHQPPCEVADLQEKWIALHGNNPNPTDVSTTFLDSCRCSIETVDPSTYQVGLKNVCFGRYMLTTAGCMARRDGVPPNYLAFDEKKCSFEEDTFCLTLLEFRHREVTAPRKCPRTGCPHTSCVLCVAVFGTDNLCLACFVKDLAVKAGYPPQMGLRNAVIVERFPIAATVAAVGKYFNPLSKNGGAQWEEHQRMMQASAYMRMMELGFPAMAEGDWEPLHKIEAFLAPPPAAAAIAARGEALLLAASGALGEEKADIEPSAPEVQDDHEVEERHMNMNHTKDEQAYQKNKAKVRMITMSWQEYYDQGMRGKNDDGSTQEFFPFRKFDVIHVDPPYDWPNHPTPQLMKKFRRLLDACSKEGTIVIIWNHWMQLADYGRMLAGGYNDGILTRWDVDPSLACVIRHKFRTVVGNGGCTMKSMTDHFMTAVRCGESNKSQRNKMQVRNNAGQTSLLEIKNDVDLVPFPNVIFESLPPNKNECLRNAKGKPIRPMSERGPALNLQLARRFVPKGGSVFDPFGGTASFGLALMLADHDASYFALDSDEALLEPATARLGRAFRLREKYQQEYAQSLVSLCAFQALASSHNAFVLPNNNMPPYAPNGKALGLVCQDNLPVDAAGLPGPLEIKPTGLTIDGVDMGEGLYVRKDAGTLKAGSVIPGLHFYGTFIPTSQLGNRYEGGIPGFPGVFLMSKPLEDWCLILDQRCPGAKINDARGIHAHINMDI